MSSIEYVREPAPTDALHVSISARIVIEGDFAGIQKFVMRPVPGAGGAGRRLRARSFRVLALTQLVADEAIARFKDSAAELLYCAGGRFAVVAQPCADAEARVEQLQADLDGWLLEEFNGELQFFLACAAMEPEGRMPASELSRKMRTARLRPLSHSLMEGGQWKSGAFFLPADPTWIRCKGCGCTAEDGGTLGNDEDELCRLCRTDTELGRTMPSFRNPGMKPSSAGGIRFLDKSYTLVNQSPHPVALIDYVPQTNGETKTFEQLAERSRGRSWLGYLRMDADRIGEAFRNLQGNPARIRDLSVGLNQFFTKKLQTLIETHFQDVYPVYSGGDDLFMIGPWNEMIDFAQEVSELLAKEPGEAHTISGGLALAKPRHHILSKSEEAQAALAAAKEQRACFHALGQTLDWQELRLSVACAKDLSTMYEQGAVSSALIHSALCLYERWRDADIQDYGYRSKLFYLIERNTKGDEKQRLKQVFLKSDGYWKAMGFILRYVVLAKRREQGEGHG